MSAACRPFQELHELEAAGRLTARQFARLDRHRESCSTCAELARAADTLQLFQPLGGDRREPGFWSGFNRGLLSATREEGRLSLGESFGLLRPAYRVGLAAAVVVVAGFLALMVQPGLETPAPGEIRVGAIADPGAKTLDPTVEMIRSPEATVYEMKVFGEGDEVTQLVMIFDEGIDL